VGFRGQRLALEDDGWSGLCWQWRRPRLAQPVLAVTATSFGVGDGALGGRRWQRRAGWLRTSADDRSWPRLASVSQRQPRPASIGHGGRWLPFPLFFVASVASSWWRCQGAGWCVLLVSRWCFRLRRGSSSGGVAEVTGSNLLPWSHACGRHGAESGESLH
jgi:hypothetical protein